MTDTSTAVGKMAVKSTPQAADNVRIATLSIVVPTFNEAENVALLVEKVGTVLAGEA